MCVCVCVHMYPARTVCTNISALKPLFQVAILLFSDVELEAHSESFGKVILNWMLAIQKMAIIHTKKG